MSDDPTVDIELIEPDRAAFDDSRPERSTPVARRHPLWQHLAVTAVVAAMIAVAVGVVVTLRPWATQQAALTDRLVIAGVGPPTRGGAYQQPAHGTTTTVPPEDMALTAVFATPGATMSGTTSDGANGSWLAIESFRSDPPPLQLRGNPLITVQGAPGSFIGGPDDAAIVFGPVDGFYFSVYGIGPGRLGVRQVAEAVRREGAAFTFTDETVLGEMEHIGDVEASRVAASVATAVGLGFRGRADSPVTLVCYGADDGEVCLAAAVAGDIQPEMLHLVVGNLAPISVRGHDGWTREWAWTDYGFDPADPTTQVVTERHTTMILWLEGGVLIGLRGDVPADQLVTIAASIHRASAAEWEEVEALRLRP